MLLPVRLLLVMRQLSMGSMEGFIIGARPEAGRSMLDERSDRTLDLLSTYEG